MSPVGYQWLRDNAISATRIGRLITRVSNDGRGRNQVGICGLSRGASSAGHGEHSARQAQVSVLGEHVEQSGR